jgi:hypothetical protein
MQISRLDGYVQHALCETRIAHRPIDAWNPACSAWVQACPVGKDTCIVRTRPHTRLLTPRGSGLEHGRSSHAAYSVACTVI